MSDLTSEELKIVTIISDLNKQLADQARVLELCKQNLQIIADNVTEDVPSSFVLLAKEVLLEIERLGIGK